MSRILSYTASGQTTFERLTRLAARTLGAPVAQVNLVSDKEQISISSAGPEEWAEARRVSLDFSYCKHVIHTGEPLVISDAREHPLVRDNSATTESGIVAYAAVPLMAAPGMVVGTLCVVDFTAREWNREEIELLESLGEFVLAEIQRRGHSEAELLHLTAVLESTDDALIGVDRAGTIASWNPGAERLLGFTEAEIIGRSIFDLAPPEFQAEQRNVLTRAQRDESTPRYEARRLRRDGSLIDVSIVVTPVHDLAGRVIGSTSLLRDISSRVAVEEALKASEARFRAIIERGTEIVSILEADGSIRYQSPAVERVLGYPPEAGVGGNALDLIHPDDASRAGDALRRLVDDEEPISLELRFRQRDGLYRVLQVTGTNLLTEPAIEGIVVNSHDITALRQSEERLRQVQKMEAVGKLAGGIAHDFNNILLVIKGCSSMVLADLPKDSECRGDIQEIDQAADRAANLTRQLLAFSRQQVLEPEVLDLNEVVANTKSMLRRVLGEDVQLLTRLDTGIGHVRADRGQLEQILLNLCLNARDAMPTGGKLITETQEVELSEPFGGQEGFDVRPGVYVLLSVSDSGTGMSSEVQSRVFEPFFTTKATGEGTGLGLSTVYGIVKQSGGYIWVYSEEGRGTTFKIYLPRIEREEAESSRHSRPQTAAPHATILLVEDDAAVRATARRMLERMGHSVLEAEDGETALQLAAAEEGRIDLLLTDVVMPNMSGRELAKHLWAIRPEIRVLYTSGYTDEAVVRHGILEGSAFFLQKPYQPSALADKLASVLGGGEGEDR